MKLIFRSLKPYTLVSVRAPLFKMLEALFDLCVPLVMADMIDVGIASRDTTYILGRCGILVLLGVLGFAASVTAQFFAAKSAVGAAADLRHSMFAHILSLGWSETDSLGGGTLITRMTSDIQQVQNGLNMSLRLLLRSPFIVAGAAVFAFRLDRQAGLLAAGSIPILAVVIFVIMAVTSPLYLRVQQKTDRLTTGVQENLVGVRVVRAFHMERRETQAFQQNNASLLSGQVFVGRISALLNPLTLVVVNLFTAAILYTGAIRVEVGSLQQGDVIALVNYMSQILIELIKLANLIVLLSKGVASAKRLQEIADMQPAMTFGDHTLDPDADAPAVAFSGATLQYTGAAAPSLTDISFTAEKGETIGVIGGTGSGKSSLVHLIPRFYDTSAGTVRLFGRDVRTLTSASLRRHIAIVPQKAQLFSGTIRNNLTFSAPEADDAALWTALETAQAADFVRALPQGLDAPVEQCGRNFSGGQRQRLTIARALVADPDILILDDSASALDLATDAALRKAIRRLPMTVFIVSQRINSIRRADRILVLDDGVLIGCGTHEALLETCSVYRDIFRSQTDHPEVSA